VAVKFTNNAFSTLSAGISNSATSFDVASVATFPTLGGSDHMYLSIIGGSYTEIIKVTGVSGTTLTCVRGQDGTTGTAANSGDRIELRVTTAMLQDAFSSSFSNITDGTNIIVADSTSDTLTITGTGGATVTNTPGTDTITINAPAAGVSAGFSIAMSIAL
tara:strand:+ start:287 stop:769 length:483 start_codon:yes stop_codon:yes gene_type:complete